jgi:broad specificity phosphatase PhoE
MAVDIFIARHGQDKDNVNRILNGHRDLSLTDLGRIQAKNLAAGIKKNNLKFDVIYSSPLLRALETAEIVSYEFGLNERPVIIPELIERNFGVMTGQPINSIEEKCAPDIIKSDTTTYFLKSEGAETFPELIERGHRVLEIVRSKQKSGKALLVCHGDVGKMIYVAAIGKDWKKILTGFHFANGDLIEVGPQDEVHIIKLLQHNL